MSRSLKFLEEFDSVSSNIINTYKKGLISGYIEGFADKFNSLMSDPKWSTKEVEPNDEYDDTPESQTLYYFVVDLLGDNMQLIVMTGDSIKVTTLTIGIFIQNNQIKWKINGEKYDPDGLRLIKQMDASYNTISKVNEVLDYVNRFTSGASIATSDDNMQGFEYGTKDAELIETELLAIVIKDEELRKTSFSDDDVYK